MSDAALRRLAWLLVAIAGAGAAAQAVLLGTAGVPPLSTAALGEAFPIITAAVVVGACVGAVIIDRHPRHRIGWLFCVGQAGAAIGLGVQELALPGNRWLVSADVGQLAGWLARLVSADYALALLGLLLLTVPDGRLPSPRWRPVAGLLIGGWAIGVVALLMTPRAAFGEGTVVVAAPVTALRLVGDLAVVAGLIGAAVALVVRLRRARGAERRQLRWIAAAAATLAFALVVFVVDSLRHAGPTPWPIAALFHLGYLAVPVATGFAVLRYRLYGIDVIIGRTVRLAALAVFVTAGYVAVVVGIGTVLGGTLLPSVVAYVLVALAFQPLRRRVDRLADRIVHGEHAAPYDSLATLSRSLREVPETDAALLRLVAHSCAAAAGARAARAMVTTPGGGELSAGWPDVDVDEPTDRLPIRHGGEIVGGIGLVLPPGHAVTKGRRRLLDELAAQAGLAFHNVALTAALRARATGLAAQRDELAASRRRLRAAVDAERERVAATIRSAVTVHLASMPAALDGPVDPDLLDALRAATERAIAGLREVTAGILPPLLARRGVVAAITDAVARRADGSTLAVGDGVVNRRFEPVAEATAYLCGVAALDAAPGARIGLDLRDGHLVVAAADARLTGLSPSVVDRVEALGGQLRAAPFAALIPLAPPADAQTAARLPGPNADLVT